MKSLRLAAMAIAASLAATLTGVPAMAQDSSALGTWDTAIDVQGAKIESTLILTEADDGFGVEIIDGPMPGAPADAPPMASVISDVSVDGATFTFKRALTTPQGAMNLTYSGTADGDSLTGQILSDFGPIALTGTRAEAAE